MIYYVNSRGYRLNTTNIIQGNMTHLQQCFDRKYCCLVTKEIIYIREDTRYLNIIPNLQFYNFKMLRFFSIFIYFKKHNMQDTGSYFYL